MDSMEYAEYMLKNHRVIKKEIEIMELDLKRIGLHLEGLEDVEKKSYMMGALRENRFSLPVEKAEKVAAAAKMELEKLEGAIGVLDEHIKGVITDLYVYRLNWLQVSQRRFISYNTINLRRRKGIKLIAQALDCHKVRGMMENWHEEE